jgi:hypothetical protein
MNVIVNRELKNRLCTINSIEDNRATVQNDFRLLLRMSKQLIIYMAQLPDRLSNKPEPTPVSFYFFSCVCIFFPRYKFCIR